MDDLISRAAAIDAVLNDERIERNYGDVSPESVIRVIESLPAVDAAPVVHGRWIDHKDEHQCSVCREHTIVDYYVWKHAKYDYCPNCGAKMDG